MFNYTNQAYKCENNISKLQMQKNILLCCPEAGLKIFNILLSYNLSLGASNVETVRQTGPYGSPGPLKGQTLPYNGDLFG